MTHPTSLPAPARAALLVAGLTGISIQALAGQDLHVDRIGHDYGAEDAPVQVIEFSDFGCQYCRQFHQESYAPLFEEYVASGRIRWKYVTFVSGMFTNSKEASLAAECVADQGHFDAMRDRVFEAQAEWKGSSDPAPLLLEYAREVGADPETVAKCVAEGRTELRVDQGTRLAHALGVRGTPTFVVDGFPMMGALPIDFLREVFERRLAAVGGLAPARR